MDQVRISERPEPAAADAPAAPLDPQMVETLRALLAEFAQQSRNGAPPAEPKKPEKEKEKKPEDNVPLFWKLCSAALLSVSALIAVTLYNQLNATGSQLRSDLGQLRGEVGQLRTDLVPKDDYNGRVEGLVRGIKDVQAANKAAADAARDRSLEQKATLADLRSQIKEQERELLRLREQLSALELREAAAAAARDKRTGP
jgi:hypothetical protein